MATMHVKNGGWGTSNFQDLTKKTKRNPTSAQYHFVLYCSKNAKLSYQKSLFCKF